jgi:hypothetical protein
MLLSAILGSTIFDSVQILVELILFLLLIYGVFKTKLRIHDILLLSIFAIVFCVAFLKDDFLKIALIFKIYGLCILTFIYFKKVQFYPESLINTIHFINAFLIVHQFIFGHFIIPSAWFFGQYQDYANSRPVGLFLTPHASSFFIAIYSIYIIVAKRKFIASILFFLLNLMTGSFTGILAFLAQITQYFISKSRKCSPIFNFIFGRTSMVFFTVLIFLIFIYSGIYKDLFIDFIKLSPYTRSNSVEIILNQLFDSRFFSDIFKIYPRDYQMYLMMQENIFADYANEIGFVRVFVEAGFFFGLILILILFRELKFYRIFIFVSLLHYSFAINMPFMLFLMIQYDHQMSQFDTKNKQFLKKGI